MKSPGIIREINKDLGDTVCKMLHVCENSGIHQTELQTG